MARLNISDLRVQSFATTRESRPAPASLGSWNPTECDCTQPGPACTDDCVWESRATDVYACCG